MNVEKIAEIIRYKTGYTAYQVANKILKDSKSKFKLCSAIQDINKIKGICNWIKENNERKITGNQHYTLSIFIAENISNYGNVTDEISVAELLDKIYLSIEK